MNSSGFFRIQPAAEGDNDTSMSDQYILMNKNIPVFAYILDDSGSFLDIEVLHPEYAPPAILTADNRIDLRSYRKWQSCRSIPGDRNSIDFLMDQFPQEYDPEFLKEYSYSLSLSDPYWTKPMSSEISWENINFFQNDFSTDAGELLFQNPPESEPLNLMSPDNTTDGKFQKKWMIDTEGKRCLIKSGNSINNQEPYGEAVACALYKRILLPEDYVEYHLASFLIDGRSTPCSVCEDFIDEDHELISAWQLLNNDIRKPGEHRYDQLVRVYEKYQVPGIRTSLSKMIVCDFILGNYDRHTRNFGVIRNINTLEIERCAPLFDSGSCLGANRYADEIQLYKSKPFDSDPQEQLSLAEDLSWLDIGKLSGFEKEAADILCQNPRLSEKRIEAIQNMLEKNIRTVADLVHERSKTKMI